MTQSPTVAPGVEQQSLLTDEQIIKIWREVTLRDFGTEVGPFARAIERAAIAAHLAGQSQATRAVPEGWRETLQAAKRYIEQEGEISGYGFSRPANPHHFHPDAGCCSPEEIAAHKAACEAYDKGEYTPERGSEWVGSMHILRAPWGIGSYSFMDEQASKIISDIDHILAAPTAQEVTLQAAPEDLRECVRNAVTEALAGLYYCGRVWSAWGVGTMSQDDFSPADEDDDIIENVTDAAINAMVLANVTQQAAKAETAEQAEGKQANVLPPFAAPAGQHDARDPHWLLSTMDGKDWADEFCRMNRVADHGTMLTWFCCAIMTGYDTGRRHEADEQSNTAGAAKGGGTNDKGSDLAPTTSTVSAPEEVRNQALKFTDHIISGMFEGGDWDGGAVQDMAIKYGLLDPQTMQEPCGEGNQCQCAQNDAEFPVTCYRKTYMDALRTTSGKGGAA